MENQFIGLCGLQFREEEGIPVPFIVIEEKHRNPYGMVHGGLMFTLADTAAGAYLLALNRPSVTLNSEFHYFSNCSEGEIKAVPRIIKDGKTVTVLRVEVISGEGKLLAEGTFTYFARS